MISKALSDKRSRKLEREVRKAAARKRIHHDGVYVKKGDVKTQRYLAAQALPHSDRVASIHIRPSAALREAEENWQRTHGAGLKK